MTLYSEVVSKVKRMSRAEKLAFLRVLADSLGDESSKQKRSKKALDFQPGRFKPTKDSSLFSVLGVLRDEGKPAPNDEDVELMIADYLIEKHA